MRELFAEVLELQEQFSSENTPEMQRRGELIRNLIPNEMRNWRGLARGAALPFQGRVAVHGRDGTGRKTFTPWIRIHSPELSPSAQNGWYVVYLFEPDGDGVSLCISHGSTRFDGQSFIPRRAEEIEPLLAWARTTVSVEAVASGLSTSVDLRTSELLGQAYERTTAYSKRYTAGALPSDDQLQMDLTSAVGILGALYRQLDLGRGPEAETPEIAAAQQLANEISRPGSPSPSGGQGFGLSADERKLVEIRAMSAAREWLTDNGFEKLKDTSAKSSFDFSAVKGSYKFVIEVKGTTAGGEKILITAAEVAVHRKRHPYNILIVVSGIELMDMRRKAVGGAVSARVAWDVGTSELEPISYRCVLDP